ncbi:MAG: hypothetical protein AAB368_08515, partial [bacterium]
AGSFSITETVNGFIGGSNHASLQSGYNVSFLIQSNSVLTSANYELTYAEEQGSEISLNNYITHEVVEINAPIVNSIQVIPNSNSVAYGSAVYLRANISDDSSLGLCGWKIYGAESFYLANSTQCKASFVPLVEGMHYINATPVDYYNNAGVEFMKFYIVNLLPVSLSVQLDKVAPFYNLGLESLIFNATFNVSITDSLGICQILVKNESDDENIIGIFSANGNSCYGSINLTGLADGKYRIFARVTEISDGNIIESNLTAIFFCSQTISGICKYADFNLDGISDLCGVLNDTIAPNVTLISPAEGTSSTSDAYDFGFNVSDSSIITNCSLIIDNNIEG